MNNNKRSVLVILRRCVNKGPVMQTYNILANISESNIECKFLTMKPENQNDSLMSKFHKLPIKIIQAEGSAKDHLIGILFGKGRIAESVLRENPDVIHTTGIVVDLMGMRLARKTGCKHVATIRNYVYDDYLKKFGNFRGRLIAAFHLGLIRHASKNTRFVCCSESLSRIYEANHGIKMQFIRNGVDTARFEPDSFPSREVLRDKLGLPRDREIYITVAQIIPRKNISEIIQVFCRDVFKNKILLIIGNGIELEKLKKEASGAENIYFAGAQRNVEEWLKASDIFVSSSRSEGLPNSVIEAMSMGLPVILSDIDQHKEIFSLNNGIGCIYSLGNKEALAQAISEVSEEWKRNCSKNSLMLAHSELSAKRMSLEYQQLYLTM